MLKTGNIELAPKWSSDIFESNYGKVTKDGPHGLHSKVGLHMLRLEQFKGRRWIQWQASSELLCLHEVWIDDNLLDNAVCIQLPSSGAKPLAVDFFDTSDGSDAIKVTMTILLNGGVQCTLSLTPTSQGKSVLSNLVAMGKGLVMPIDGMASARVANVPIPRDGIVRCAAALDEEVALYGLNNGEVLAYAAGQGMVMGLLAGRKGLMGLLSGLVQQNPAESQVIAVAGIRVPISGIPLALAVDSEGILRMWDLRSESCVATASVFQASQGHAAPESAFAFRDAKLALVRKQVDTEEVLCIAVAGYVRSAGGGMDSQWRVVQLSCSLSALGNGYSTPIRVDATLKPPLTCKPDDTLSPAQELVDIAFSCSSESVVSVWRDAWTSREGQTESQFIVTHQLAPSGAADSPITIHPLKVTQPDSYLHGDAVGYELGPEYAQHASSARDRLVSAAVRQVFAPGRFHWSTIRDVIYADVPEVVRSRMESTGDLDVSSMSPGRPSAMLDLSPAGVEEREKSVLSMLVGNFVTVLDAWAALIASDIDKTEDDSATESELAALNMSYERILSLCRLRQSRNLGSQISLSRCASAAMTAEASVESVAVSSALYSSSPNFEMLLSISTIGTETSSAAAPSTKAARLMHWVDAEVEDNASLRNALAKLQFSLQNSFAMSGDILGTMPACLHRYREECIPMFRDKSTVGLLQITQSWDASECGAVVAGLLGTVDEGNFGGSVSGCSSNRRGRIMSQMSGLQGITDMDTDSQSEPPSNLTAALKLKQGAGRGVLLSAVMCEELRQRLRAAERILLVLALLVHPAGGAQWMSRECLEKLSSEFLPRAEFSLAYVSYLFFLYSVRPAVSVAFQQNVEIADVTPNCYFATKPQFLVTDRSVSPLASVLENFWVSDFTAFCYPEKECKQRDGNQLPAALWWDHVILQASSALQATPSCALMCYLLRTGQTTVINQLSLILQWGHNCMSTPDLQSSSLMLGDAKAAAAAVVEGELLRSRLLSLQATVSLLDLACASYESKFEGSADGADGERLVNLATDLGERVLAAAPLLPSNMPKDASFPTRNKAFVADSAASFPQRNDPATATNVKGLRETVELELSSIFECFGATKDAGSGSGVPLSATSLCLSDTLAKMIALPAFAEVVEASLLQTSRKLPWTQAVLATYPHLLQCMARISYFSDCVELLRRCCAHLPGASGSLLCLRAARERAAATMHCLQHVSDMSNSESVSLQLKKELMKSWFSAFEFAIEGHLLDDALMAVLRLHELEAEIGYLDGPDSQRLSMKSTREGKNKREASSTWRTCFQSLVSRVCVNGGLGWLCSLPHMQLNSKPDAETSGGLCGGGLDLKTAVAEELEYLATSVDLDRVGDGSGYNGPVNYYEHLAVFLLSNHDFKEVSRVLQAFSHRIDDDLTCATASQITAQMWALSAATHTLALLPASHSYALHRHTSGAPGQQQRKGLGSTLHIAALHEVVLAAEMKRCHVQLRLRSHMPTPFSSSLDDDDRRSTAPSEVLRTVRELIKAGLAVDALSLAMIAYESEHVLREGDRKSICNMTDAHTEHLLVEAIATLAYTFAAGATGGGDVHAQQLSCGYASSATPGALSGVSSGAGAGSGAGAPVTMGGETRSSSSSSSSSGGGGGSRSGSQTEWKPVFDLLARFDGPSRNWGLHEAVARVLCRHFVDREASYLPDLVRAFGSSSSGSGGSSSGGGTRIGGGGLSSLLGVLVDCGRFDAACEVSCHLLQQAIAALTDTGTPPFIPLHALDNLLVRMQLSRGTGRGDDGGGGSEKIEKSRQRVEALLQQYFRLLVTVEAGQAQ